MSKLWLRLAKSWYDIKWPSMAVMQTVGGPQHVAKSRSWRALAATRKIHDDTGIHEKVRRMSRSNVRADVQSERFYGVPTQPVTHLRFNPDAESRQCHSRQEPLIFRRGPHQISGMLKQRQIFLASLSGISVCRGTASTSPVCGLVQSECERPSRFR